VIIIKPPLLVGREYFYFFLVVLLLFVFSLMVEFYHYTQLTQFDDTVIRVDVLKHYTKSRDGKKYGVLKLRTKDGVDFYITSEAPLKPLTGYEVTVWMKTKYIDFFEYIKGFVTKGAVVRVAREKSTTFQLGDSLNTLHKNQEVAQIYGALFFALPLSTSLQEKFSMLGVSHLLAISGFHLGVLSFLLFMVLKLPYVQLQRDYFPFRHGNRDLFIMVAFILGMYLLFLGDVASLLRAYSMLLVGYVLHDRGLKIVSLQTLVITVILLLALWPKLLFSLGFWLSVSGVYFIFLYFRYFEQLPQKVSFVAIAVWVYLLMTPISLVLFGNYSPYHLLSILWSLLFTLFYPSALLLHSIGLGDLFDGLLESGLAVDLKGEKILIDIRWLIPYLLVAIGAYWSRWSLGVLISVSLGITIATIYQVT